MRELLVVDHGRYYVHAAGCPAAKADGAGDGWAKFPAGYERAELAAELLADAIEAGEVRLRDYNEWVRFPDCCEGERDGNAEADQPAGEARNLRPGRHGRSAGVHGTNGAGSSRARNAGSGAAGTPAKATQFAEDARAAGWDAEISTEGDLTTVTAMRGVEEIRITWKGEACQDGSTYKNGGHIRTMRNAAACRRQMAVAPGQAVPPAPRRIRSRASRSLASITDDLEDDASPMDAESYRALLPFDLDDEADQILKALLGREITWRSSLTKGLQSAVVLPQEDQKHFSVDTHPKNNKRILTFAAKGSGFRSVYLSSIVAVS